MSVAKKPVRVRRLVLPTEEDVEPVSLSAWNSTRFGRLAGYVAAGRPVWWRREGFNSQRYRDSKPKWHIFTGRYRREDGPSERRWDSVWHAACGYERFHTEVLFGLFDFRVVAPSKAERCEKCDAMYAQYRAECRRIEKQNIQREVIP